MTESILYNTDSRVLAALLFIGIILFYFIGLRVSQYQNKKNPAYESKGIGAFEGALLGLLSLLLAFTFNKSSSYYDIRRELLIHETNCIGTALHRSDLYPDSVRQLFRSDFKEYITERINYYEDGDDEKEIQVDLQKANIISERIWSRVVLIIAEQTGAATKSIQMIPAVNDMMSAVSSREEARSEHVPESILWLLFILCITGSFIVGYASKLKKADWIILFSYSLMTVMTVYLILDLDEPGHGTITTSLTHQNMYNLLNSFQEHDRAK